MIYNRQNQSVEEDKQYGSGTLNYLYNKPFGRLLLKIAISPVFSKIYGEFNDTVLSTNKIPKFIKDLNIDMSEYENKQYDSFNEFFARKKKNIDFDNEKTHFISPADSKLMAYKITDDLKIKIKQSEYTLEELLQDQIDLDKYKNGNCLVFRLSVDDYHRYCFVDDGIVTKRKDIKGVLHTVSSISNEHKIYSQNSRICNYLKTENFGEIIYIEVGALLVGKIQNHNMNVFKKGEEKGYFEFGGSTIVIITPDNINLDSDILEYSDKEIETKVKYGERIGELKC